MADFLANVYRPWAEISNESPTAQFRGPTDELDYSYARCELGFNYQAAGGAEREYVYAVVRWMALQVGRRRRRFAEGGLDSPAPYYGYDEGVVLPVLLGEDWPSPPKGFRPYLVDQFGLPVDSEVARDLAWFHLPVGTYERISVTHHGKSPKDIREAFIQSGVERAKVVLQFIRAEVARLDALWAR
jgi:hypothetical protein